MTTRTTRLRHARLPSVIARTQAMFERWSVNFDTRKQLLEMDDRQLRDIGVDWVDAEKEGQKPFWKA